MMRQAPESRRGYRVRAMIVVLWRAGLRVQEALALIETVAHGDQSGRAQCLGGERGDHREGGRARRREATRLWPCRGIQQPVR